MSNNRIFIYLDNKPKPPKDLDLSSNLNLIRELLKNNFSTNFVFMFGDVEIQINEEKDWKLQDVIKEEKDKKFLYLKTKVIHTPVDDFAAPVRNNSINFKALVNQLNKNENKNEKNTNIILKGSKKLYTKKIDKGKKQDDDDSDDEGKNNIELDIYQYPLIEFSEEEKKKAITFLVIGETGSGKTTLINSFVNALMGVTMGLNYRYVIVSDHNSNLSQAQSQTQEVSIYNIKTKDGKYYQIVDTPGYGDVRGITQDKIITEKISKAFKEKLHFINAVCFVARSSSPRLTPTQKYIFHSIFELFGENITSNIIAMLTFCDGEEPQVLAALQEPGSVYDKIIPHVESPWYYKFNNSAFFSLNINDQFTRMFWDLGMRSFKRFIKRLEKLKKIDLNQTKEVLTERKKLENLIIILQEKLTIGLDNVSQCKEEYKIINDLAKDVKDSEKFTKEILVNKTRKIDLPQGKHTTTCLICNFTCHKNCFIADNDEKMYCAAMINGNCIKCSKKCSWKDHKNTPYILEHYLSKEVITLEELKKKYDDSKSKIFNKTRILENIKNNIYTLNQECIETQEKITETINRLRQIALNKDILSSEEHIELLIQSEKLERKEGFLQRVDALELLKKQKKLMREAYQNKIPSMEELKKFLDDTYEKENKLRKSAWCNIF